MSFNQIDVASVLGVKPSEVLTEIDKVFKNHANGSILSPITNSYRGINHRVTPSALPINKDHYGLTLFTRPMLNLSTNNLRQIRELTPLLSKNEYSLGRVIRCLLDPRLDSQGISSPLVDNFQAFIPIMTDTLLSNSGWPDVTAPTITSNEGVYKETYTLVDGICKIYGSYDLSVNFRNTLDDPVTMLLLVWVYYACAVFEGIMVPYPEFIVGNAVDYQCRIWRLVLDETKTRVQKIACTGVAVPTAVPIGSSFNYESDRPINSSNDQISTRFQCNGAIYMDPILVDRFNRVVSLFNTNMTDGYREARYKKIPNELLVLFNHKGYPRINPDNWELEWWVSAVDYKQIVPDETKVPALENLSSLSKSSLSILS